MPTAPSPARAAWSGAVVERYLDNPFFAKSGPKSLDRGDFTLAEAEGLELADGARTLAAVSAEAILKSVEHLPLQPKLWIVAGGGRKNPHIFGDLREGAAKAGAEVILAEDAGLRGDFIEAEAWAYLAVRSLKGLPLTFPTTTGCREAVSGGVLVRPGAEASWEKHGKHRHDSPAARFLSMSAPSTTEAHCRALHDREDRLGAHAQPR